VGAAPGPGAAVGWLLSRGGARCQPLLCAAGTAEDEVVERPGSGSEDGDEEESPAVHGGEFSPVVEGQERVGLVHDEVGVRHGAGGEDGAGPGEQAEEDEGAADELDEGGPPSRPGGEFHGLPGALVAAEYAEQGGHSVAEEHQAYDYAE